MIVVQLVVAGRWGAGDYSLRTNTISDLGAVTCTTLQAASGPVEVCSPWHALMNATFLVLGVALAVAGSALLPSLRGVVGRVVAVLLVVAGLSSAGVGLVPLDVDGDLHTQVATPLFVAQPLALLLFAGLWGARGHHGVARVVGSAGVVAALGAIGFGVTLVTGDAGGLLERVALWPCHLGLAVAGAGLLRRGVWQDRAMSEPVSHPRSRR